VVRWVAFALVAVSCGPGNVPADYAPGPLRDLGIHQSPIYVARYLMPARSIPLVLAHPRLGQAAIRRAGETVDISWIAPGGGAAQVSLGDQMIASGGSCDPDGICKLVATLPELAPGLYELCVDIGSARECSSAAVAIVGQYSDPATLVHLSDAHIGADQNLDVFTKVVDAVNALEPPADFVIFTGDAADTGRPEQRAGFVAQLSRLNIPSFVVTGNHDYDAVGIDGHLLDIGPELDFAARYGALRLLGLSSGQDLDDGNHNTTISESSGPDQSQLDWLARTFDDFPTLVFFHHPIYNPLFATIGPDARDTLKDLVTRDNVIAVLTGHTHVSAVFDADGNSRGLSLDAESDVPFDRFPIHYSAERSTRDNGGFAILHVSALHLDYRWVSLP
jgi:hypothetical protein